MEKTRCDWAQGSALEQLYHDNEWGTPLHDDHQLFELLILESMQAGLSWLTILKKRSTLTAAYDQFDCHTIARYTQAKIDALLADTGVIRNRAKIKATITNAQAFLRIQAEYGSFDHYIWSFVSGKPIKNHWQNIAEVPASTPLSDQISKDLKKHGFRFMGTTTVYAFLQSAGIVNDHLAYCYKNPVNIMD